MGLAETEQMEAAGKLAHIGRQGCQDLAHIVEQLGCIPGEIVELGAYRGGTALAMALATQYYHRPPKQVYSFDTFCGMPEPGEHDKHKAGDFGDVDYQKVKELIQHYPNLHFVRGEFLETLPNFRARPLSFLFMDCDLYDSYKIGLATFWPMLSADGLAVFEDYGQEHCPGATRAVNEFFAPGTIEPIATWHGVRKKPCGNCHPARDR